MGNSDSVSAYLHGPLGLVKKSSQTTDGATYTFDNPATPGVDDGNM